MNGRFHVISLLLGIDVGTHRAKGSLVNENGELVARESVELDLIIPREGWAEHDPESSWWKPFVEICRSLTSDISESGRIKGIGISSIAPAVVPVDRRGDPLRNASTGGNRVFKQATRQTRNI